MRLRTPLRITPAVAASGVCLTMGLLPSLWVSWQAPIARGVVLPALAILTLALLPREAGESRQEEEERKAHPPSVGTRAGGRGTPRGCPSGPVPGSSSASRLPPTSLLSGLLRPLWALAAYPALLYLTWGAICAARAGGVIGGIGYPLAGEWRAPAPRVDRRPDLPDAGSAGARRHSGRDERRLFRRARTRVPAPRPRRLILGCVAGREEAVEE